MDSVGRLKLIIIGLILLAIGIGYYIFAQRTKVSDNTTVALRSPLPSVTVVTQVTPTPAPTIIAQGSPLPQTGVSGTSTLPATGVPLALVGVFSISAGLIGFGLKRFPK